MNHTSLRENDYPAYRNWILWCRGISALLNSRGPTPFGHPWRARDVEMAVFTAWGNGSGRNSPDLRLNSL